MRHVWSSLRDRLGLGSGAHNSNHPNDTTSGSGLGQSVPPQPSDIVRPRDPREIMLAEMARAFNLGLGLGGATASTLSAVASANSDTPQGAMLDAGDALAGDREGEQPLLPPPDSFERFLMDLQSDLRVTLMQEQDSGVLRRVPQDVDEIAEDVEGDQPIPELQSLSDSDSEEFETRHLDSGDEDEHDGDGDVDVDGDEVDVHTAQEQLSGRTSPAFSVLGAGIHSPLGVRTSIGSTSHFHASGTSLPHTAPSQSMSTAVSSSTDAEVGANNPATDSDKGSEIPASHASSSLGKGAYTPVDDLSTSAMQSEEELEGQREGAVSGVAHSPGASNGGRRVEAEGGRAVAMAIAMPPHDTLEPSNVPGTETRRGSFLPGTSSLSIPLPSNTPNSLPGGAVLAVQDPPRPSTWALPLSSDLEPTTQSSSSIIPIPTDSSMPLRLPFTPSSTSRTEHTPGGGINWWRMYRFPAVASPNQGQPGGLHVPLPPSQPPLRAPTQGPSHTSTSSWTRTTEQSRQNEIITPRGVAAVPGAHSGLAGPALTPSAATPTNMPELVSIPNPSTGIALPTNGQASDPSTNTSTNPSEHRGNVVVPVIVVGLQSVNMDRQPPHMPHPYTNPAPATDDEDSEGLDSDSLEQPMSTPLHIPEPAEFRHHSSSSNATQEQGGQQSARGRTWQSRAANAIRNLRPSRRNADTTSPQPQETPGSRTFLIYVIGGTYLSHCPYHRR